MGTAGAVCTLPTPDCSYSHEFETDDPHTVNPETFEPSGTQKAFDRIE